MDEYEKTQKTCLENKQAHINPMKCTHLVTPRSPGFRGAVLSYTSCLWGHSH